ncbi:MAG TPA: oligopeptide:H+ symporter, partial [Bacteriovoracaceae bacterium]|nr:oligopeptide:H+ symporter [Bacteriovoracaceae bacterium]
MTATTHTESNNKFPSQIKYIVGNEACERYSYYGMRSILTVFMIQVLLFQETKATSVYHLFAGACYLTPLLGAWISDRIWGKYKTILYLSLVYCVGHAVLAIWETEYGLYAGLGLIALGSGGIKPCVSAHVGDQFKANQQHLLKKVYELFYFMINFGSFFSTLITPWTLDKYGPSIAFGIPGILMFIATFIFWLGRKEFVHVPPTKSDGHGLVPVVLSAFRNRSSRTPGTKFLDGAITDHSQDQIEAVRAVFDIAKLFAAISVF